MNRPVPAAIAIAAVGLAAAGARSAAALREVLNAARAELGLFRPVPPYEA